MRRSAQASGVTLGLPCSSFRQENLSLPLSSPGVQGGRGGEEGAEQICEWPVSFCRAGCVPCPTRPRDAWVWAEATCPGKSQAVCPGKSQAAFPWPAAPGASVHPRARAAGARSAPGVGGTQGPDAGCVPSLLHIYPCACPLFFCRCPISAAARGSLAREAEGNLVQEPPKSMRLLLLVLFPMPCSKPRSTTRSISSLKPSLLRPDPPCDLHCVKQPQRPQCTTLQISVLS